MGQVFKRDGQWYIDHRVSGRRIRKKIGTHADALAALKVAESRAVRGEYEVLDSRMFFDKLAEVYMASYRLEVRASTFESAQYPLAHLVREFEGRMVSGMTLQDVDVYRARRIQADGRSRRTLNIEVGLLKRILRFGEERRLIGSSPLSAVKPLKEQGKRFRRALRPQEVQALLAKSTPTFRPIWLCFVKTGLRKSELIELRWPDVDLDNSVVRVESKDDWDTKTGDIREIPIAPDLLMELKRLKLAAPIGAEYVFATKGGRPRRNNLLRELRRQACRAKIDLKGLDLHALRYTFITELVRQGVNPKVVQVLAGHKSLKVTMQIYCQVHDTDRVSAIQTLSYQETGPRMVTENGDQSEVGIG